MTHTHVAQEQLHILNSSNYFLYYSKCSNAITIFIQFPSMRSAPQVKNIQIHKT